MKKSRGFPKIFFGWWTVVACSLLTLWGAGYYGYGMSALFKPIASGLSFSRATTSVAAGIGKAINGPQSLLTGWLSDRFGPRWIIVGGVFLIGLGLILMNFIDSLWAFYLVWGVTLGTGVNIALELPMNTAISNWFVKKRGTALGIRMASIGLAGVLVLPLVAWLIVGQGWRMTCVTGGLVMWLVGLPLAAAFVRQHRPEYYGLLPDGATTEEETAHAGQMMGKGADYAAEVGEVEFTFKQAIKTRAFWLLVMARGGYDVAGPAIAMHSIPLLTDMGIEPMGAAGIVAIMALVSIPARFVIGFLVDRVTRNRLRFLIMATLALQAIGITTFVLDQTLSAAYVLLVCSGTAIGAGMILDYTVRARYFGRKSFGSIQGASMLLTPPLAVLGPIYVGWVYDTTGSYVSAFAWLAALIAFFVAAMPFAMPPKPPTGTVKSR